MVVFLAENARIPVDDPNTHLELTMIHEVMVLDHSGPDFALIQYAARVEDVDARQPAGRRRSCPCAAAGRLIDLAARASLAWCCWPCCRAWSSPIMARLRLVRVPQFLIAASVLSIVALVLVVR